MEQRMSWDELHMSIVCLYARMSRCKHFKIGAVAVRNRRILAAGFNGPLKGKPHCTEFGCRKEDEYGNRLPGGSKKCRGAHAEMNVITNAAEEGIGGIRGATLYCTYSPCYDCSKNLIQAGIKEYVYLLEYEDEKKEGDIDSKEEMIDSKIIVRQFSFYKKEGT